MFKYILIFKSNYLWKRNTIVLFSLNLYNVATQVYDFRRYTIMYNINGDKLLTVNLFK